MAAESEDPVARERSAAVGEDVTQTDEDASWERVGPLELLRTHKADGRALLIFSRADDQRP